MKKILVSLSVALLAATSFSGAADARPGKHHGHAYGHYKHQRYAAPAYGYYHRRSNNGAIAAGVAGAILGGALAATARPAYRTYERPAYGYYSPPRRSYYRDDYYDGYGY